MKKLTTIILMLMTSFVFAEIDNDILDIVEVLELNKTISEQKKVADYYISQRIYQLEAKPKFMASRLAYRNTFMWYIWNEYEEAKGFNKLEIGEQIYKLTK